MRRPSGRGSPPLERFAGASGRRYLPVNLAASASVGRRAWVLALRRRVRVEPRAICVFKAFCFQLLWAYWSW